MVCAECGAAVPDDARWCGRCGAGMAGTAGDAGIATLAAGRAPAEDLRAPADDPSPGRGRQRVLLAVGMVAAAVAAAVLMRPASVPAGTLGHVGAPPGLVADGPLPSGELALAWEHVPPGTSGAAVSSLAEAGDPTLLGDGLVLVDDLVVDTVSRETVGALPSGARPAAVGDGAVAILVDGERVTHDVRTGGVIDRVPLTGVEDTPPFVFGALPDGTLVARAPGDGPFGSVLVASDGAVRPAIPPTVVEELLGGAQVGQEVLWDAVRVGPVFVVEVLPVVDGFVEEAPARQLVDVATGALLGQLPEQSGAPSLLAPVGEGVATVVDERVLWGIGPDGGVSELELVGPDGDGTVRLLGAVDDRIVLARRGDDGSWLLQSVTGPPWPAGTATTTTIGTVDPPPRTQRSDPSMTSPPGIVEVNDTTVTDDLVVVLDDDGAAIVARDLTGTERWRRPAAEGSLLSSAGRFVLVTEQSLEGVRGTLLDSNGREVWSDVLSGPRFAPGPRLVDGDAVYTDTTFPLHAVRGEPVTDRGPQAPEPDEAPLAVIDDPDGIGTGVLAARRTGGADGTQVITLGDDVVIELAQEEFDHDELVGIADGVLLVHELRMPSADRVGIAAMTETSVLVQPDGTRIEVDGTLAVRFSLRTAEVGSIAVTRRDDGTALLDPATGEPRFVLPGRVTLSDAGDGRLVAQQRSGWWVVDALDGTTVGERHDELVQLLVVGDGFVAAAGVDGSLEVVRTADGQTAGWQQDATMAPTVVVFTGDHLLVGTRDGRVLEHDVTGDVVRTIEVGHGPVTSIATAAGTLVVGVDDVVRGFRTDGDGLTSRDEVNVP